MIRARMSPRRRPLSAALAWALLLPFITPLRAGEPAPDVAPAAPAAIRLVNFTDGTLIRYPVPLLRGTLADAALTEVTVVNATTTREFPGVAHRGRFKALVELAPGENRLRLRAGAQELALTLVYKPQTNPYVVRAVYFTDAAGRTEYQTPLAKDEQDYRGKFDTALKLLQSFTAESMNDAGFGRATFNLELDADGKVKVHLLKGRQSAESYEKLDGNQLYDEAAKEIGRQLGWGKAKNLVIPAFTRFDAKAQKVYAHTALGGGDLAFFGGGDLFTWPNRIAEVQKAFLDATRVNPKEFFSDSVGRHTYWANASTTIGAALHELGHTFGLPHSQHPFDIMTRGIDYLNRFFTFADPPHAGRRDAYEFPDHEVACWPVVSAAWLAGTRHFALDERPYRDENRSAVRLDPAALAVVAESESGIRALRVYRFYPKAVEAVFALPQDAANPPKEVRVPLGEIGRRVGHPDIGIEVLDGEGLGTGARLPELLNGPFVQTWRFAQVTRPWEDRQAFVKLDEKALDEIAASAAAAPPVRSPTPFVDFLRFAPGPRKTRVAAYALRTIRAEQPRTIKILTGSDDALRLWLNGKAVAEVLQLRGAVPDSETATVDLKAGENALLAEVSQEGGGWGLILRLTDAQGGRLELKDDGELVSADSRAEVFRALLRGPFVRRWCFAPATCPWKDKSAFVALDAAKVKELEDAAAAAPLAEGDVESAFVDFAARIAAGPKADVAGYALRTIRSDTKRSVRVLTGSDDALRLWLNGRLIQQVLKFRGATPDADSVEAELQPGENRLLVEVSNGGGGWGLILRLESTDGTSLELKDDGRLAPFGR
jgi:hypothetical protein